MGELRVVDVRGEMPVRPGSPPPGQRTGAVLGVAVHHSATANVANGLSLDTARTIFEHQVLRRGWQHGGYHYVIRPNGMVEYALDEAVPGFHAGFVDPTDELGLERGQFWNEHYLAVCVLGWFESGRQIAGRPVPDYFTRPTDRQWSALVALVADLCARYRLPADSVRGHGELRGNRTRCPGRNLDVAALRALMG
jgi:N-acetyl-anhydromuramyl-L-alanine amidase AmpD